MRKESLLSVVGLGALIAGCTNTSNLPLAPTVPEPTKAENLAPYYLQPGDVLDLRLMLNPELNEEVTIRPDGHISTTVVPDQVAAGLTTSQLAERLRREYRRDVQNPRLSILVKTISPMNVYVGGEVAAPGVFTTAGGAPISLSQALARSGGVRFGGDDTEIFIIRRNATNQSANFYRVRYQDVTHAVDPNADVLLAPNDIVYVPKTTIAEVYAFWNQYVEQFAHPSFGFSYIVGNSGGGGTNNGTIVANPVPATPTPTR
jgi:polysaccharide export outer membrane protein